MTEDTESESRDDSRSPAGPEPADGDIEPAAPESFGLVQVWWGAGKGKTTAGLGMGFRAAGHGYRVHVLQFMKGGAGSVEDVRGEYNAIAAMPGISCENAGHYGWHGSRDSTREASHAAEAEEGLNRSRELLDCASNADLTSPFPLDGPPEDGFHMLVLDEILYAANRGLVDPESVVELVEGKPENLELVLTGGHEKPEFIYDEADLVSEVRKEKHPFDAGQDARKGTEF